MLEVLHPDYGGPADPQWSKTLHQPKAGDDYEPPKGQEPKPRPDAKAEAKPAVKPKPGKAPAFGPSGAKVEADDDALPVIRAALGKGATPRDVASAVGAPDDAAVKVERLDKETLSVEVESDRYLAGRLIKRRNGKTVIENSYSRLDSEHRGKGLGAAILGRQVEQAARLGVDRIEAKASRGADWNGYYTWPRLGFDAPIPFDRVPELPDTLKGAERLSDLMATPEGRRWWKTHGTTVQVSFDLADGSLSRKLLAAYLAEMQKGRWTATAAHRAASKRVEEPDLAPGDDALLDAICDRVLGLKR